MTDEQRAQRVIAGRIGGAESGRVRSAKAELRRAEVLKAARAEAFEEAAKIAEGEKFGGGVPTEEAYNIACDDIAAAIRRGSQC